MPKSARRSIGAYSGRTGCCCRARARTGKLARANLALFQRTAISRPTKASSVLFRLFPRAKLNRWSELNRFSLVAC